MTQTAQELHDMALDDYQRDVRRILMDRLREKYPDAPDFDESTWQHIFRAAKEPPASGPLIVEEVATPPLIVKAADGTTRTYQTRQPGVTELEAVLRMLEGLGQGLDAGDVRRLSTALQVWLPPEEAQRFVRENSLGTVIAALKALRDQIGLAAPQETP